MSVRINADMFLDSLKTGFYIALHILFIVGSIVGFYLATSYLGLPVGQLITRGVILLDDSQTGTTTPPHKQAKTIARASPVISATVAAFVGVIAWVIEMNKATPLDRKTQQPDFTQITGVDIEIAFVKACIEAAVVISILGGVVRVFELLSGQPSAVDKIS